MRKLLFTLFTVLLLHLHGQSLRDLFQEGLQAYDQKNYVLFRDKMLAIDQLRPNYPAVVYNLSSAYALTGDHEKSIETLKKYLLMDATHDFAKDNDFNSIISTDTFKEIEAIQQTLVQEIGFNTAFKWELASSHPESITYSDKQGSFFIGGVRDGSIWEIPKNKPPKIFANTSKNSWAVMGLEMTADGKQLWACTSSMSNYKGYDQNEEGFASVLQYETKSGELLNTYSLDGGHNFGDLIIDAKGNVYISDGTANQLYCINKTNNELEVFLDLSEVVFNLQGLTLNEDQSALYVSDYIDGIYRINIENKSIDKLKVGSEDILLKGIDGLYFRNNSLIGLHNGTQPNRIIQYELSSDGLTILSKTIKAQAGTLGEPTQGVWVKDELHFISNSPWGAYDQDGNFNPSYNFIVIGKMNN